MEALNFTPDLSNMERSALLSRLHPASSDNLVRSVKLHVTIPSGALVGVALALTTGGSNGDDTGDDAPKTSLPGRT